MSLVRETIELLSKILKANGSTKIKAEVFRLAKFDKDEGVVPLWRLLFELLYFLDHGIIDDVAVKAYSELTTEELCVFVKRGMQQQGFYSRHFSLLPNDMSHGSRELILATSWLLCTKHIVDQFMENCASPLDTEFPQSTRLDIVSPDQASVSLSPVERVQQLQLLNGKLHHSLKRLYSLQRERTRLQHRVHESTQGVGCTSDRTHLSVLEVHLLRHPDYLKKLLHLLEKDNTRLQYMLQWKDQEDTFWKWMGSVLELKMQDNETQIDTQEAAHSMIHFNIPPDLLGRMNSARRHLEAAILKYEPIIEQLEEIWETKCSSIDQSDLDSLLSAIDLELDMVKANIASDTTRKQAPVYREPVFIYSKPVNRKFTNIRQPDHLNINQSDTCVSSEPVGIQTEISKLETLLETLELQAKRKERLFREELDRIATSIPDTICIEPMSLR